MALKDWERNTTRGLSNFTTIWQRKDGIIGGISNNTKYPFLAVTLQGDGYAVRVITYSETKDLKVFKTKSQALAFARKYMRTH